MGLDEGARSRRALMRTLIRIALGLFAVAALVLPLAHCHTPSSAATVASATAATPIDQIIRERNLSPDEAAAALKVFVPPGKYDDFVMITSGGHRGTVMLYGIPSMRLLKEVPVYAPDAWQGWGQGGPFSEPSRIHGLSGMHLFLASMSMTALAMSTIMS